MNIFVGSLPYTLGEADLRESFEAYGSVDSVKIIIDRTTGRSKGYGFVQMPNDEEGQRAVNELNGSSVGGRPIVVNESEARPEQPRRSFSGGGGRSGGGFNRGGGGGFNRDNNNRGGSYGSDRGGYNREGRSGGYDRDNNRGGNGGGGYNRGGGDYNRGGNY